MNVTAREVIEAVGAGPAGPRIGAFFDLDGTLVRGYTAESIYRDRISRADIGPAELARAAALEGIRNGGAAHAVAETGLAGLRGRTVASATETGERLFAQRIAGTMRPEARDLVRAHREMGHTVVVASSATRFQIEPVARDLGITHISHPELRRAADDLGWPVLTLREPRSPGLRAVLGTIGGLAGVNIGLSTGLAYGWLTGDHRLGVNTGIGLSADLALAHAGVRLDVVGADKLEKARPAVFIANHQSTLDVVVLGALLRHDFTAVAKKEARHDPRMLAVSAVLDPVFVDRSDLTKAKQSMDGVVRRLRAGTSILIFPEGTRMPTPTLGRFKKGAFHIARQAGVPIVPIVLRNTGELAWRRSLFVNPGTVDVAVLDPIPAGDWPADELDQRIAEVRGRFADTLAHWPHPVCAA